MQRQRLAGRTILWLVIGLVPLGIQPVQATPYNCIASKQTPFLRELVESSDLSGFEESDWKEGSSYDLSEKLQSDADLNGLKDPLARVPDAQGLFESITSCMSRFRLDNEKAAIDNAKTILAPLAFSALRSSRDSGDEVAVKRYARIAEYYANRSGRPASEDKATRLIELEQLKHQLLVDTDSQPKNRSDVIAVVRQHLNELMDKGDFSNFGVFVDSTRDPMEYAMGLLYSSAIARERALHFIRGEIGAGKSIEDPQKPKEYDLSKLSVIEKDRLNKSVDLYKSVAFSDESEKKSAPSNSPSNYTRLIALRAAIADVKGDSDSLPCFYPKPSAHASKAAPLQDVKDCIPYDDKLWASEYPPENLAYLSPLRKMDAEIHKAIMLIDPMSFDEKSPIFLLETEDRKRAGNISAVVAAWDIDKKPLPLKEAGSEQEAGGLDALILEEAEKKAKSLFPNLFIEPADYSKLSLAVKKDDKEKFDKLMKLCALKDIDNRQERLGWVEGPANEVLTDNRTTLAAYPPTELDYFEKVCVDVNAYFIKQVE